MATIPPVNPLSVSWEVNITSILVGIVMVIGYIGSAFTMKAKVDAAIKGQEHLVSRADDGDRRHDGLEKELATFQLQVADRYVKKDDLRETEGRLTERMAAVEHEVRQIPMKIAGLMRAGAKLTD